MLYNFLFLLLTNTIYINIICIFIILFLNLCFSNSLLCEDHPVDTNHSNDLHQESNDTYSNSSECL